MKNSFVRHVTGFAVLLMLFTGNAKGQAYTPKDKMSHIAFSVGDNMIVHHTVTGTFSGLKGTIVFSPTALNSASFDVSVNSASISTGIGLRDNSLKKEQYFYTSKYPVLQFKSTGVEKGTAANSYVLHGHLIIKGISKAITIPFTAVPQNGGYLFTSHFALNRQDFNVGGQSKIDNQVSVSLKVFAGK